MPFCNRARALPLHTFHTGWAVGWVHTLHTLLTESVGPQAIDISLALLSSTIRQEQVE